MRQLYQFIKGDVMHHKAQAIASIIILTLTCTLLFSAFALLHNASTTVDETLDEAQTSDLMLWFDESVHDVANFKQYFEGLDDVKSVQSNQMMFITGGVFHNEKVLDSGEMVFAKYQKKHSLNHLRVIEGAQTLAKGEMFISSAFAYAEGINVGDEIRTGSNQQEPLTVSAIVFDPIYSSEFMPPRLWLHEDDFNALNNAQDHRYMTIEVLLYDRSETNHIWEGFILENPNYMGYRLDYDTVHSGHSMLLNIMGASLLGFSIILIFVGLFIVYSLIKRHVFKTMTTTGILKAIGFDQKLLRLSHSLKFILIAIMSFTLAFGLGFLMLHVVSKFMLRNLGLSASDLNVAFSFFIMVNLMLVSIFVFSYLATKKIKHISPVQALNDVKDSKTKPKKLKALRTPSKPLGLYLSLKQLTQKKAQALFVIMLLFFTAFSIYYGAVGIKSLEASFNNMPYWGEDNRDLTLRFPANVDDTDKQMLKEAVLDHDTVEGGSWFDEISASINQNNQNMMLSAFVYSDFDRLGLMHLSGRSPKNVDEVSISTVIASTFDVNLGDTLTVYLKGEEQDFVVVGIYQTVVHMGRNIRLIYSDEEPFGSYLVKTNSTESFLASFKETFDSRNITVTLGSDIQHVFDLIQTITSPVMVYS